MEHNYLWIEWCVREYKVYSNVEILRTENNANLKIVQKETDHANI